MSCEAFVAMSQLLGRPLMLGFHRSNLFFGAASALLSLVIAACSFEPPREEVPGTGGTGGGSSAGGNATSSTSSSTSSTSSTTSSSSASSSGSSGEFCTNGLDDDKNDVADCADPACQNITSCINSEVLPGAPWSAPFYATYVNFDAPEPTCSTGSVPKVYGVGPSPDGCSACDCAIPDRPCTGAVLTCFPNFDCTIDMFMPEISTPGCNIVSNISSCMLTQPGGFDMNGAQCTVKSGGKVLIPNAFAKKMLQCDAPTNNGTGCATGQTCALLPAPEYTWSCIAASGSQKCPVPWTNQFVGYGLWNDSRGCTECSCKLDKAVCPPDDFLGYNTGNCTGAPVDLSFSGCNPVGATNAIKYTEHAPFFLPDGCTTSPTGKLDVQELTTICCRP